MYEGPMLSFEENVMNSRVAIAMSDEYGAGIECEVGSMGATGARLGASAFTLIPLRRRASAGRREQMR